jgi:hypothetical protein
MAFKGTLALFKLSDGTAAVDMQVALVSAPFPTVPGEVASVQIATPDGPVGSSSVEDSNDSAGVGVVPAYNGKWDPYPTAYMSSPTQPADSGDVITTIAVPATCAYRRAKWTPSSGGTAILPTMLRAVQGSTL